MGNLEKKTTDLSQIFKQKDQDLSPTEADAPKKVFSFLKAKEKQKIEFIILIIILALTAGILIYSFLKNKPNTEESFPDIPGMERVR